MKSGITLLVVTGFCGIVSWCDRAIAFQFSNPAGRTYSMPLRDFELPPGSAVSRTALARLNGDPDLDLVVLRGGRPEMYVNPGLCSAALGYPSGAASPDLAVLPVETIGGPSVDEVLTIGTTGLEAWAWDSAADSFSHRGVGTGSVWTGVTRVRTAPLSGASRTDVVGYRSTDQELVILVDPDLVTESESSFSVARPALDIVPFVRNASGTVHLALRTSHGILVYSLDGQYQQAFVGPSSGALVAVRKAGTSYDELAWFHPEGSGHVLEMIRNDAGVLSLDAESVDLGEREVVAAVAADFDGEEGDDLIVSHRANYQVLVMLDQGDGTYSLDLGETLSVLMGPTGSAAANQAWPAVGDLDHDGDADIVFANSESGLVHVFVSNMVEEMQMMPVVAEVEYAYSYPEATPAFLRLTLGTSATSPASDYIEVSVWSKPLSGSTVGLGTRYLIERDESSTYAINLPLDIAEGGGYLPDVYFWVARFVDVDGSEATIAAHAASVHGFTSENVEDDGPAVEYLFSLSGIIGWQEVERYRALGNPVVLFGPEDTTTTSTIIPIVPDYDEEPEPTGGG